MGANTHELIKELVYHLGFYIQASASA